jgi:uncharacterized protein involved in exopolysaccharide biosynthesis
MTDGAADPVAVHRGDEEISLLALGSVFLRHRMLIAAFALLGAVVAFLFAITGPKVYVSTVTFIPQASQQPTSGLALAASQLGIVVPSANGAWRPSMYIELLGSRELLEPIARDTLTVAEQRNRRFTVVDLLKIKAPNRGLQTEFAIKQLRSMIVPTEVKTLGGVRVKVATAWPSVSLALANRVVKGINDFNIKTRRSEAGEELRFVEEQAVEAESALRSAEDRLQAFLQSNRVIGSPELSFERDRLQRAVSLRQELQTSWLKSREDARIREVRDIPVITVFEAPRLPLLREPRKSAQKAILGGIVGGILGVLIAFISQMGAAARREHGEDARQFFDLVEEAKPKFLRKVAR